MLKVIAKYTPLVGWTHLYQWVLKKKHLMSLKNIYLAAPGDKLRDKNLVAACGIEFPDQGLNLGFLHWRHGVLAPGPPVFIPVFMCMHSHWSSHCVTIFLTVGKISWKSHGHISISEESWTSFYIFQYFLCSIVFFFFSFLFSGLSLCLVMSFAIFILANKSLDFFSSLKKLVLCIIHYVTCHNACPLSIT